MCVIISCSNSECTDVGWLHQVNYPFKRNVNTFPPCVIMALFSWLSMESAGSFPFGKTKQNKTHKTWQVVHSTSNMWWQLVCWFIGNRSRENILYLLKELAVHSVSLLALLTERPFAYPLKVKKNQILSIKCKSTTAQKCINIFVLFSSKHKKGNSF